MDEVREAAARARRSLEAAHEELTELLRSEPRGISDGSSVTAAWITPQFAEHIRALDLSERGAGFIEGFASACASLSHELCSEPDAGKSYDPMTVDLRRGVMDSYVFDMKDGGRHHPLADYRSYREIADCLLAETLERLRDS